jgi:hypothetical protein
MLFTRGPGRVCCILLPTFLLLVPSAAPASVYVEPDALVATAAEMDASALKTSLAFADDGTAFAAVSVVSGPNKVIKVYRSLDDGRTWSLWSTLGAYVFAADYIAPTLHLARGTTPRLFLGFIIYSMNGFQVGVAYADPTSASPTWSGQTLTDLGNTIDFFDIGSTADYQADYSVFVVTSRMDGGEMRFKRSADKGVTWGASYVTTLPVFGYQYHYPKMAVGFGGVIHVGWSRSGSPTGGPPKNAEVLYQRALNWAVNGMGDWQSVYLLTHETNGADEYLRAMAASWDDGKALMAIEYFGSGLPSVTLRASYNYGGLWAFSDSSSVADANFPSLVTFPDQGGFGMTAIDLATARHAYATAGYPDPLNMSVPVPYPDAPIESGSTTAPAELQVSRAMGNRLGYLWGKDNPAGTPDSLFFEGDWFRADGFPQLEAGFPMALSSPPVTHPGVAQLDGDAGMEIFFADSTGYLHVLNHDGTELSGWPVYVGQVPVGSGIASGDIDGDGAYELVVGTAAGVVRAYEQDGAVASGYPIDLDTGRSVYVSIGPLWSVPDAWQVVAVSGQEVHAFSFGAEMPGFPLVKPRFVVGPAAIGDLDRDGYAEIVTALEDAVHVDRHDGTSLMTRAFARDPLFGPVSLAECDGDPNGDLEIAVATGTGTVTLMHHTGADLAGWPVSLGAPALTPTLVRLRGYGSTHPMLVVPLVDDTVHLLEMNGTEPPGWPKMVSPGTEIEAPAIADMIGGDPFALVTAPNDSAYTWDVWGFDGIGWPIGLGEPCLLSAASWDLDYDGSLEVVFLTDSYITIMDVHAVPAAEETWRWPMYGNYPERSFCLNCWQPAATGVGGDLRTSARGLMPPAPNPMTRASQIAFAVEPGWRASVEVFDLAGRLVRTLARSAAESGSLTWDGLDERGREMPAGIYMVRLTERNGKESRSATQRLTVVR